MLKYHLSYDFCDTKDSEEYNLLKTNLFTEIKTRIKPTTVKSYCQSTVIIETNTYQFDKILLILKSYINTKNSYNFYFTFSRVGIKDDENGVYYLYKNSNQKLEQDFDLFYNSI